MTDTPITDSLEFGSQEDCRNFMVVDSESMRDLERVANQLAAGLVHVGCDVTGTICEGCKAIAAFEVMKKGTT